MIKYAVFVGLLLVGGVPGQELKHLTVAPQNGARPATLMALSTERGAGYPSAIHLKGAVEVRTPVCLPAGDAGKLICDGEMILRADEATYHEESGEIEASGPVSVTPLRHMRSPRSAATP